MRCQIPIMMLASILMLVSCSHKRSVIYRSTSPDGAAEVQAAEYSRFPVQPSEVVELQLSTNQGKKVIKTWKAKSLDMYPCFVAAAWSHDSRKVIVLFRNCYSLGEVVAFDVRSYAPVGIDEMKPLLAAHIRTRYSLGDRASDPIAWANDTVEAQHLFAKTEGH
jgi:hypothetical protein